MAKNHNGILAKMLASFARDASPEEIEEAVTTIDEITTEPEAPAIPEAPVEDEAPDKMDMILEKLDQLLAAQATDCKDAEPEEEEVPEEDPLAKLEKDLDEMEKAPEEEAPMNPEEDSEEPESQFVDPEEINEEDEEPEVVEEIQEEEEEKPVIDRKACDAARIALNALKPVIAKLPPSERKQASDAAVEQIRKASGLDAQPKKNGYVAIKKARKAADRQSDSDIGKRIMEMRNPHYRK